MKLSKFTLVTVVAEPILASKIKTEILEEGSSGVTICEVSGEGSRNLHSGEIPGNKIKIECIVDSKTAERILKRVSDKYFGNFSLIVYTQEVEVLRSEKFRSTEAT